MYQYIIQNDVYLDSIWMTNHAYNYTLIKCYFHFQNKESKALIGQLKG